jgi:N-acetylmuramic acid 6-phosphate (MurNAc-6-P) etherase
VNAKQLAKVAWFVHRTGCDAAEAEKFLKEAKFRIDEAIKLRRDHWQRVYSKS